MTLPQKLGKYEIRRELGSGAMGIVYEGWDPGIARRVAIKTVRRDQLERAEAGELLARFQREAQAAGRLSHPNIVAIYDYGEDGGTAFIAMEFIEGRELKDFFDANERFPLPEIGRIMGQLLAALGHAHQHGIVHRDIKPANIWLRLPLAGGERFDPAKHRDPARVAPLSSVVIDFGMVRAIRVPPEAAGRFVAGTVGYIAPEQVLDPVELDPRSDVYALAGTLYNVTTGRTLFDDVEGQRDRVLAHMRRDPFEDPQRLRGFPAEIAKLLRAATARDPADRPSPMELGRAFVAAL